MNPVSWRWLMKPLLSVFVTIAVFLSCVYSSLEGGREIFCVLSWEPFLSSCLDLHQELCSGEQFPMTVRALSRLSHSPWQLILFVSVVIELADYQFWLLFQWAFFNRTFNTIPQNYTCTKKMQSKSWRLQRLLLDHHFKFQMIILSHTLTRNL